MQKWEEQRELFPGRGRMVQKPSAKPRIRPNFFARIARVCTDRSYLVLTIAVFIISAAVTLAALGARFDFARAIEFSIDPATQAANQRLLTEFPTIDNLITIRTSSESAAQSKAAAQAVAAKLRADEADFHHAFIPGIGAFYDRFGLLYLKADEIDARIQRVRQSTPLFEAIGASPNLSGLSSLVNQVADAVQKGRSPRGLEQLFLQISNTIQSQVNGKPLPMDWRKVAGLTVDSSSKDWVIVVEPQPGRLKQARIAAELVIGAIAQAQPSLKITPDYPAGSAQEAAGSTERQVMVSGVLACVFALPLLVFGLRGFRAIVLALVPILVAILAGLVTAVILARTIDGIVAVYVFAALLPVSGFSCCMSMGLTSIRRKSTSAASVNMLAAHSMGPLIMTLASMAAAMWLSCIMIGVINLSKLAVVTSLAVFAGMLATLVLVPALATLWPPADVELPVVAHKESLPHPSFALWRQARPVLAVLLLAATLFCAVFFLSLHFDASRDHVINDANVNAKQGLQFIVDDGAAAAKLASELAAIPEVGTVRWMGTFLPQDVGLKQQALRALSGVIPRVSEGGFLGPHDPVGNLHDVEAGLRTISDSAGTDEGLRASAHEFRRSLALLLNTAGNVETTIMELERLLFSGFGGLADAADDFARLPAPKPADIDVDLRRFFISDNGKWRVEALPKRVISGQSFVASVKGASAPALGPLIIEQAEQKIIESRVGKALAAGFALALGIALIYLRRVYEWVVVVLGSLLPLSPYAALAVVTETAISPTTIPALIIVTVFGMSATLLIVVQRRQPQISWAGIFLPAAIMVAIALPLQLLHVREFEAFSRALIMLLACAGIFNIIVVQQLCDWFIDSQKPNPPQQKPSAICRPKNFPKDMR